MKTAISDLLKLSLGQPDDLRSFYASLRDWFTDHIESDSLIFYQPEPLENLPFQENHEAESHVLRGDAHPPGKMEVSAIQFRDQGICQDENFLIQFQSETTWFGALEGAGDVPELITEHEEVIEDLFKVRVMVSDFSVGKTVQNLLFETFELLENSDESTNSYRALLEVISEVTGCEELAFYRLSENHFELDTSMGFDADELVDRQFYPREQLRQLGMDEKFYALEPTENNDKTDLFLPLTVSATRQGLIVAYDTAYSQKTLSERDKLLFRLINVVATMATSVIATNLGQDHDEIWDRLTSLRTESFFLTRLEQEVERGDRYGYSFSLLLFEVENLDELSKEFGESTINELIRKLSHLVKTTFRIIDTACRFDNHQFGVLFPNTDQDGATKAGERLIKLIDDPFLTIGDREISIRLDGGVAKYPEDGGHSEDLLKQARLALYEAKQSDSAQLESSQELNESD